MRGTTRPTCDTSNTMTGFRDHKSKTRKHGLSGRARRDHMNMKRVAATDFTILIEGGSGPQPHPSFIEVFCLPPLGHGYWEVEGAGEDGQRGGGPEPQREGSPHKVRFPWL